MLIVAQDFSNEEIHIRDLLLKGRHALDREGASVLNDLLAHYTPTGLYRSIIGFAGFAIQHTTRAEQLMEILPVEILRIIRILRLLLRIQVVEVAIELIETTYRREVLVQIPKWFLPNWPFT